MANKNIYETRDNLQKLLDEGNDYIENDMGAVLEVSDMDANQYRKEVTEPREMLRSQLIEANNIIELTEITQDFNAIQNSNLDIFSLERGQKSIGLRNKILENIGAIQSVFYDETMLEKLENPSDFVKALEFYAHDENVTNPIYKEGVSNLRATISQKELEQPSIKEAVQGVNNDAPALQNNLRSKPMANTTTPEAQIIKDQMEKISQREILMSFSAKFDRLAENKQSHITKLIKQNESMAALNRKVEPIVKNTFSEKDAETIMAKLDNPKHKRKEDLALVTTLANEPEKLGKVVSTDMLDMLDSQRIVQDYTFHVEKHSKVAVENAKAQGELGTHGKRVNYTVEDYGLEAEYNEFIKAKTPEEKLQTRIVTGYELAQADLRKTLDTASPEAVREAVTCDSKGNEVKPVDKLNTHKEVAKFQELAAKNAESKTQTKTQARTKSM